MSESAPCALLLTGTPGVGKTTLIRKAVQALPQIRICGFCTAEIRQSGQRQGFRISTFDGRSAIMAHTDVDSPRRVGKYRVDLDALDGIVAVALAADQGAELYVIDEIGKMECFSACFVSAIERLLASRAPMIATISRTAGGTIGRIRSRPDVELWQVTQVNRNDLVGDVVSWALATCRP
jgi:nucleoside-triphosphatase